ncbi:MAG: hypothetical protein Q8P45_01815 [Candidatus Harrisonbacteria bacterium]|nr:hypothetical protein [Candidatus Harrisonbacteria bacterium]
MKKTSRKIEEIHHFHCVLCKKWWSVSQAPKQKKVWYCPWCGQKQG